MSKATSLKSLRKEKVSDIKQLTEKAHSLGVKISRKEIMKQVAKDLVDRLLQMREEPEVNEFNNPVVRAAIIHSEKEFYSDAVVSWARETIEASSPDSLRKAGEFLEMPLLIALSFFKEGTATTTLGIKKAKKLHTEVEYFLESLNESFGDTFVPAKTLYTFIMGNKSLPPETEALFSSFKNRQKNTPAPNPSMPVEEVKELLFLVAEKLAHLFYLLDLNKRKIQKTHLKAASRMLSEQWNGFFKKNEWVLNEALEYANNKKKEFFQEPPQAPSEEETKEVDAPDILEMKVKDEELPVHEPESGVETFRDLEFGGNVVVSAEQISQVAEFYGLSRELAECVVDVLVAGLKLYAPTKKAVGEYYNPLNTVMKNLKYYRGNKKLYDKAVSFLKNRGYVVWKKKGPSPAVSLNPKYAKLEEDSPLVPIIRKALEQQPS